MQYVTPDQSAAGASQPDSGGCLPSRHSTAIAMHPNTDTDTDAATRIHQLRTVMSPSIEDDFARLFSFAEKSTGGEHASLHTRELPASFWKMPGVAIRYQAPGLPAANSGVKDSAHPVPVQQVPQASQVHTPAATAKNPKKTPKKKAKKANSPSPIAMTGKVFLPITDRTPRKQDGRESPIMSPSPASKGKGKKRPKNRRKLTLNGGNVNGGNGNGGGGGGGGRSGRASAPPPQTVTLNGFRSPAMHDDVDAEVPCALQDVVDPRLDAHRAPTRSHSMPDLGTLGIVWEFPESNFGGFDVMLEDGDSMPSPSHHGSIPSPGGLDADTLSPGSAQDINITSPGDFNQWDSELKLFSDGMVVPGHEDTEMALYADKVTMDYRPALHDSSTHDPAMDHRSAFRPTASIGVQDLRDGPSGLMLSTNGVNDALLGHQGHQGHVDDVPFVTE